jgi:hypothetical protein
VPFLMYGATDPPRKTEPKSVGDFGLFWVKEDFSERWDSCPGAYLAFNDGIRRFASAWRQVCDPRNNPGKLAKGVFGEVIDEAILLEARAMQADRGSSLLGIASSGRIVPVAAAFTPMIRNTNHGKC